ncbi:hypothetical protein LTR36_009208 [Oleoguttula mirabilis]|uniref:Uncharacterized protein n=1 Tax=Oleoguttula mirabilis TaxID=1507867 RepID=A0AAV9J653_9PEZI|nr:hypothetical protein LTR36_009208 [Oleoguttula mirabilis]
MAIPEDCVQGVLIRSPPADTSTHTAPQLMTTAVPKSALTDPSWLPSPLSAQLGVPLKIKRCQLSERQTYNYSAQLLMLDPDPEDAEFGKSVCDPLKGDVLVVRAAGLGQLDLNLRLRTVQSVVGYIREELGELRIFWRTEYSDRSVKAREIAEARITTVAFGEYRERA